MLAINSVPDHLHMLIGFRPHQSLADLMRMVKSESSKWINEKRLTSVEFHWQAGYAAFSYTKSLVSVVARYIENQEEHHKKESFQKEFEDLLNKFGVEYDQRYLFIAPE